MSEIEDRKGSRRPIRKHIGLTQAVIAARLDVRPGAYAEVRAWQVGRLPLS